jgi:drug/metabolite transporter (DMT)-like permease
MALLTQPLRDRCPWQTVALARSGLATAFALAAARLAGVRLVFLRPGILWMRSVAGSCSMVATFYALARLPVSDVLTITNTFPVWVAVLSWPLAGERPTAGVWGAVGCAVAGVGVALGPGGGEVRWFPAACAVWASCFTAVAMLGLNRLRGVAPLAVVVHFSAVSTLVCGSSLFLFDVAPGPTGFESTATVLNLIAVGATATVGQVFLTRAYATGSATKVSVVGLTQVVMVMAFEAAAGWKPVTLTSLLGTALVLGPAGWLMARERRPPKGPDETELEEVAIE